jgi:hypothetical protein
MEPWADILAGIGKTNSILSRILGEDPGSAGSPIRHPHGGGYRTFSTPEKAVKGMAETIKMFHGHTDTFVSGLGNMADRLARAIPVLGGFATAVELATAAFSGLREATKTFSKMSDVGQNFNGSVLEMMRQVGESGLSTEQFTTMMTKQSMVAASMLDDAGKTLEASGERLTAGTNKSGKAMMEFQKSVRGSMYDVGFFGMSLDQLTDQAGEYLETYRKSGILNIMSEQQQRDSFKTFVQQSTEFSKLFGVSREQIMKSTTDALRNINYAAFIAAQPTQNRKNIEDSARTTAAFLSALPGGSRLAQSFTEQAGMGGPINTKEGLANIESGMQNLNYLQEQLINRTKGGRTPSTGELVNYTAQRYNAIKGNETNLRMRARFGDTHAAELLQEMLEVQDKYIDQRTGRFNTQKMSDDMEAAKKEAAITEQLTKNMLVFDSALHEVTGSFKSKFYESIAKAFGGDKDSAGFKKTIAQFQKMAESLGSSLGQVAGKLADTFSKPEVVDALKGAIEIVASVIAGITPAVVNIIKAFDWLQTELTGLFEAITPKWVGGSDTAKLLGLLMPFVLAWAIKSAAFKGFLGMLGGGGAGGHGAGAGGRSRLGKIAGLGLGIAGATIAPMLADKAMDALGLPQWKEGAEAIATLVGTMIVPMMRLGGMAIMGLATAIRVAGAFLIANPIGLAITGIATAAFLIWNNWDWLKDKFGFLFTWLGELDWGGMFASAWQAVLDLPTTISNAWAGIKTFFADTISAAWEMLKDPPDWMQYVPLIGPVVEIIKHWGDLKNFFVGLWDNIGAIFSSAWDKIKPIIESMKGAVDWVRDSWIGQKIGIGTTPASTTPTKPTPVPAAAAPAGATTAPAPAAARTAPPTAATAPATSQTTVAAPQGDVRSDLARLRDQDDSLVQKLADSGSSKGDAEAAIMRGLQEQLVVLTAKQTKLIQDIRDQATGKPLQAAAG